MKHKNKTNSRAEIPDWKCERFLLNELDKAEMKEIRRLADTDKRLRDRLQAIERSNREILREYPPGWMAQQIRGKLGGDKTATSEKRRARRFWSLRGGLVPAGLIAVLVVAVLVVPQLIPVGDQSPSETVRLKGVTTQLGLYRKTESGSERLGDGDRAAEYDLILLQYQIEKQCYGAVLSVDGWGTITMHVPDKGNGAVEMRPGRPHLMDHAYELDDAPNWEIFILVTSSAPFTIDVVSQAVEKSLSLLQRESESLAFVELPRPLNLPKGFEVSRFTLIKDSHHED
jgi:hypothetical protein